MASEKLARGADVVVLPSRGLAWADWMVLLVLAILFPIAVGMLYFLAVGGFPGGLAGALLAAGAAVVATFLVVEDRISVRRIEFDPSGITFYYPFHRERVPWTAVTPREWPVNHGSWWLVRTSTLRGRPTIRGYRLTIEQARAVLNYPSCPKWNLSVGVARSLGLQAP